MEGTRHEKVFLILIAYVIGFTTAFIAFGINVFPASVSVHKNIDPMLQASVNVLEQDSESQNEATITEIGYDDEGLYAIYQGEKIILTAKKDVLGASAIATEEIPGFYHYVLEAVLSPNGQFVYFCEQLSEEAVTCDPYVFALSDGILHKVTVDGEVYRSSNQDHTISWLDDNRLVLNNMVSNAAITPWSLMSFVFNDAIEIDRTDQEMPAQVQ